MNKKCQDCAFWDRLEPKRQPWSNDHADPSQMIMGECRRHAPSATPELFLAVAKWGHMWAGSEEEFEVQDDIPLKDMMTVWPITDRVDWCGDYSLKQSDQVTEGEDLSNVTILDSGRPPRQRQWVKHQASPFDVGSE